MSNNIIDYKQNIGFLSINTTDAKNITFKSNPLTSFIFNNNNYPSLPVDNETKLNDFLDNTTLKRACCMR
jgi:hypothetical protein